MRLKLMIVTAVAAALGLASCGREDARLAGELAGTWKGETVDMMSGKKDRPSKDDRKDDRKKDDRHGEPKDGKAGHPDGGQMSCTPTLTFVKTDSTNGGTINLSAVYTLSQGVESVTSTTPVKATVTGNVTASGTWIVEDGDDVRLTLDPSQTTVNVDTSSITLAYARVTDAPQDSLASMKARVASNITDVVKPMLTARIQKMRKFDDVKVTGNVMTLDAGHRKITFTKQ